TPRSQTFSIAVWSFVTEFEIIWNQMAAVGVISALVPVGLLLLARRYVISALTFGAVREKAEGRRGERERDDDGRERRDSRRRRHRGRARAAAAARRSGRDRLGFNRRGAAASAFVHDLSARGERRPAMAHVKMNRGELQTPPWVSTTSLTGGFLYESTIHLLDMCRYLLGEI